MLTKPYSSMLPSNSKYQVQQKDYSTLIAEPRAIDFTSLNNEVNEYQKSLDGKSSKMVSIKMPPFGRVYFQDTGATCKDSKTGKLVRQFTVVDAHRKGISLFDSASRDLANSSVLKMPSYSQINADKCVRVTIKTVDSAGTMGKDTKHVSVFEAKNISPDIRLDMPKTKESMLSNDYMDAGQNLFSDDDDNNMDAGQNLFIGSVAVLGLYLFFKILYKKN